MRLILLGSGTGLPLPDRASPSLAMLQRDRLVLFDLGPGTLRQLSRVGINPHKIAHVFISHLHPDHTADLVHLLFATRNPSVLKKRGPFRITGPEGFGSFLKKLQKAYGKWLHLPPDVLEVEELQTQATDKRGYEGFHLISQPVPHSPQSLAYRVEASPTKSFVYSGDTGFCPEMVSLAKGADLLILEASFPDGQEAEGHLTPSQAGQIATSAGAKKLVLLHFYPEALATDITAQCRKTFRGELILGRDLLHLSI